MSPGVAAPAQPGSHTPLSRPHPADMTSSEFVGAESGVIVVIVATLNMLRPNWRVNRLHPRSSCLFFSAES